MKMFDKVRDLVQDNDSFVFVMIDEVESLTAARKRYVVPMECYKSN